MDQICGSLSESRPVTSHKRRTKPDVHTPRRPATETHTACVFVCLCAGLSSNRTGASVLLSGSNWVCTSWPASELLVVSGILFSKCKPLQTFRWTSLTFTSGVSSWSVRFTTENWEFSGCFNEYGCCKQCFAKVAYCSN